MKIFIFGASGLVGNQIFSFFKKKGLTVSGSSTNRGTLFKYFNFFDTNSNKFIENVCKKHDLIINCLIINSSKIDLYDYSEVIKANSLFPQTLSWFVHNNNKKLINISSDAVFQGNDNNYYDEESIPDGNGRYSISKILGETITPSSVNIRSSFVGYNHKINSGLIYNLSLKRNTEIFVNEKYWHGATTLQLAQFIEFLLNNNILFENFFNRTYFNFTPNPPIKLCDLFNKINEIFGLNLKISKTGIKEPSRLLLLDDSFKLIFKNNIEFFDLSLKKIGKI